MPTPRKPGAARYVKASDLSQKLMQHIRWIEARLKKVRTNVPKDALPDKEWVDTLTKVTKLIVDLQREERQTKASLKFDDMTTKELMVQLEPMLLELGWTPPPTK